MRRFALLLVLFGCTAPVGAVSEELRPDSPGYFDMPRFVAEDDVESFASPGGKFRVHFTRVGPSAVPMADDDMSGTPDAVETVATIYDEVEAAYHALGFRSPLSDADYDDNGGDERFDVYLVDFGGRADGAYRVDGCLTENRDRCAGFMLQENDFVDYGYPSYEVATRILATHEYFHAIQAAYDQGQTSVYVEGTAVWATETVDAALRDYESFLPSFFERPERSLVQEAAGPFEAYSYGSAVFFQFLTEKYGATTVRELIEATENGSGGEADPTWFAALDRLLASNYDSSFAEAYSTFVEWNLATGSARRDGYGYANAGRYPSVTATAIEAPFFDDGVRVFPASARYFDLPLASDGELVASFDGPGIEVHLVLAEGDTLREPIVAPELEARAQIDGADRAFVVLVNTANEGQSERGALCVRYGDDDAACGGAPIEDAGMPDAGTPDAGMPEGGMLMMMGDDDDGGCSCRAGGRHADRPAGPGATWLVALALVLSRRRRKQ